MRGSHWDGAAHAADWYTTFAALAGATVDNTGPLPADGVALFNAIATNGSSPRTEVVLQIMSNSSDNLFEPPSAEWCATAGTGDVALCTPPQTTVAAPVPPPRPYPALVGCNPADPLQKFVYSNSQLCMASSTELCFNVQKSEDHIILFEGDQANSQFQVSGGKVTGLQSKCVLAELPGKQLLFGGCNDAEATGWNYVASNQSLQHNGLCVVAVPVPPPPPSPLGLELGVLIQGQYKLIQGYPGWKPSWDGK